MLIAAGVLGLVYGSVSYTKDTHEAKLGSIQLSVNGKETVNIPVWAGVGRSWLAVAFCWSVERRASHGCLGVPRRSHTVKSTRMPGVIEPTS